MTNNIRFHKKVLESMDPLSYLSSSFVSDVLCVDEVNLPSLFSYINPYGDAVFYLARHILVYINDVIGIQIIVKQSVSASII